MKLYVASSWRNPYQPNIVGILRSLGHEVYDFRHPPGGDHLGFNWADVDPNWHDWRLPEYIAALDHPVAVAGFESDFGAMAWADACVLVMPCGRASHLEAGWFVGQGKPLYVLLDEVEFVDGATHACTDLMHKMATRLCPTIDDLMATLA